jgi:hypothetical protein
VKALLVLAVLVPTSAAFAHPPPPPDDDDCCGSWRDHSARVEWSTWLRLGIGVANPRTADTTAARTTTPEMPDTEGHNVWDGGMGVEASLMVTEHGRLGAWAELRGRQGFAGAEP